MISQTHFNSLLGFILSFKNGIYDSNGNKIEAEFRTKEIIVPMIPITPTNEHKNYLTFLENYWFALLSLLIVIAAVVWKLRSW